PRPEGERERERVAPSPVGEREQVVAHGPFFAVEAGGFLTSRKLEYGGIGPMNGTLRGFDATSISGPRVRAELYPLGWSPWPALAGLGVFGEWGTSVDFTTGAPLGGRLPTRFTRLDLGATWRTPPIGAPRLVLAPVVAWQRRQLEVTPPIDGLPDADLMGVRVGLAAEAWIGSHVQLLAGAGWVDWLTARDLIKGSPPFFPGGHAWAIEAEAGLGLRLFGPISLRLLGEYSQTRYTLEPDRRQTYSATSARDRYLGGRGTLRVEY
ncbi:MAG TPA: hypothetical protein VFP50_16150, partial [Anaeromyxobacteraceae bacterium]|nr:hypothetical protein [Anaeromyxobacteraceae bacterium]